MRWTITKKAFVRSLPENPHPVILPAPPVAKSLARIRASLRARGLDACLISRPENRAYLSGYFACDTSIDESSGILLIRTADPPLLLTDSRFQLHATEETAGHGYKVLIYERGILRYLSSLLPRLGIRKIGFEARYTLHSFANTLIAQCGRQAIDAVPFDGVCERLRSLKDATELDALEQALFLAEKALQQVVASMTEDASERDVALALDNTMIRLGAEGPSFPTIVAAGCNGAKPHAVPTGRTLFPGEPIIIDMGAKLHGYCSDITRTVFVGEPDEQTRLRVRQVRRAQKAAIKAIRPGVPCSEPDRIARQVLQQHDLDRFFTHSLGHGVGLAVHESPSLNKNARKHFTPGMVITVEPGIYIPGWGGIRLENTVAVTETGARVLNRDATFLDL